MNINWVAKRGSVIAGGRGLRCFNWLGTAKQDRDSMSLHGCDHTVTLTGKVGDGKTSGVARSFCTQDPDACVCVCVGRTFLLEKRYYLPVFIELLVKFCIQQYTA